MFNEGYASTTGSTVARADLAVEALRLTRTLHASLPDDPEVTGLLALILLTDARRPARTGPHGELVSLADQDRGLWDRAMVDEGVALVEDALVRGAVGEYQLQAAIAAVHDEAPSTDATDWPQLLALYALLERMTGNPMVTLNRAVALAMVDGPDAGLALLDDARRPARRAPPPRRRARSPAGAGRPPAGGRRPAARWRRTGPRASPSATTSGCRWRGCGAG